MDLRTATGRIFGLTAVKGYIISKLTLRYLLRTIPIVIAVAALGIAGNLTPAQAESVCIAITGEVVQVEDWSGFLTGAINVGDVVTGTYVYESTTPDTNALPTVGDYQHTIAPFGIVINTGGFVFRTNPNNVNFLVEIVNDHGYPPSDNYVLRSYNNIFDISVPSSGPFETENHIAWQLDDPTLAALSSEALPTAPPVLADWQSIVGLTIESRNFEGDMFFIRAHVASANLCGNLCSDTPLKKVAICHKPGTPAEQTLFIAQAAVPKHLSHGDALGECQ